MFGPNLATSTPINSIGRHRTFLPIMIEQGEDAHIVNPGSIAGLITGGSNGVNPTMLPFVAN